MIVAATEDGWRCITQPDHAVLGREILALWRDDSLPDHPRREELLLAVREHDNGWREVDAAPRRDDARTGPRDFTALPAAERHAIWRRGIHRHLERRPYVAALILEHALALHRDHRDAPGWEAFFSDLDAMRPELLEAAGVDDATLRDDYRWLHLADLLSLTACAGWEGSFERSGYRGRWLDGTLHLSPFPLAGSTRFAVSCRVLPVTDYASDAELATALAASRWRRWSFRLAADSPSRRRV